VGPRKLVLDMSAYRRNLANTTEPSTSGGDAPNYFYHLLWPPNTAGHYIMQLWFFILSSFFLRFSSPILSGRKLDVYRRLLHRWCGLSANLECRSEMCCTLLAENTGRKNSHHRTTVSGYQLKSSNCRFIVVRRLS